MRKDFNEHVRGAVRAEMGRRGVSGYELARRTKQSNQVIYRRLSGYVGFSLSDVELIAAALDVPLSTLIPEVAVPNGDAA